MIRGESSRDVHPADPSSPALQGQVFTAGFKRIAEPVTPVKILTIRIGADRMLHFPPGAGQA